MSNFELIDKSWTKTTPFLHRQNLTFQLDITHHYLPLKEKIDKFFTAFDAYQNSREDESDNESDNISNNSSDETKREDIIDKCGVKAELEKMRIIYEKITKELLKNLEIDLMNCIPKLISEMKNHRNGDWNKINIRLKIGSEFDESSPDYNSIRALNIGDIFGYPTNGEFLKSLEKDHGFTLMGSSRILGYPPYNFIVLL